MLPEPNVYDLVEHANQGDTEALAEFVVSYRPLIRSWVRRLAPLLPGTGLDVEDLAQEGALAFIELVRTYDPATGVWFGAFIKMKLGWRMRNRLDWHRCRRRGEFAYGADLSPSVARRVVSRPSSVRAEASHPEVRRAIAQLTPVQRAALAQAYDAGHWAEDVTVQASTTRRAKASNLRRALARLRAYLAPPVLAVA